MQLNFSSSVQAAAVALLSYYITAKRLTHSNFTHFFMLKCQMKFCYVKNIAHFKLLQTMHLNIMRLVLELRKNGTLHFREKIKKYSSFFEMACKDAIMHTKNHNFKKYL